MSALPEILMSSGGTSSSVAVDLSATPLWQAAPAYALGFYATVSSGASLTYTVQITGDQQPSDVGYWNDHESFSSLTDSANGNVAYPITGYRLVVTNYVSGTVHLGVAKWP